MLVVYDSFPKSQIHLLIIPRDSSLRKPIDLRKTHIPLVKKMIGIGKKIATHVKSNKNQPRYQSLNFQLGVHAVPSMPQLHLHLISCDFVSDHLKNKKHYNTFTTEFFFTGDTILTQLENTSRLIIDEEKFTEVLKRELICHKCQKQQKNIPILKAHLIGCKNPTVSRF